jgi:tetratricopeptide (TPR) repeat protein
VISKKHPFLDVDGELNRAVRYHQSGRLNKAEQIYNKILKVHPNLPDCLHLKGFLAYQWGKNDKAIELITKAIEQNPNNPIYHYNLSLPFLAQSRHDEAIACLQKAAQLDPNLVQAHVNLGNVLQDQGKFDEAMSHYDTARQLHPNDFLLHVNMGNVLQSQGKFMEAISSYDKALSFNPNLAEAHYNMGNAYKAQGKIDQAISCYHKAVEVNPGDSKAYYNMGNAFQELNELGDAIACYQEAIRIRPGGVESYYQLGNVYQHQGRFQDALLWHRKALKLKPDCAEAFYSMTKARKITHHDTDEFFEMGMQLRDAELSEDGHIYMNFGLGKIYDDLGMFEEAFLYYQKANELERSRHHFDPEAHKDFVTRIIRLFDADFLGHHSSWGNDSQTPIFIIGMPRSGTSLVEQIISSHPNVFGGGELDFFFQLERNLAIEGDAVTYPECMQWFDQQTARSVADSYLAFIGNLSASDEKHVYVTDKMPHNFLFLGLLYVLFPQARFIHCQRYPLDNCLSIYFQKFARGHDYAYDLKEIGLCYKEYRRLMMHWYEVLPTTIFQMQYEDLVYRQEELSRQLIAFCGLEWNPNCLDFHTSKRPVFTSSNWQVRQPIYKSSVNRWKNYDQFLLLLRETLIAFL